MKILNRQKLELSKRGIYNATFINFVYRALASRLRRVKDVSKVFCKKQQYFVEVVIF